MDKQPFPFESWLRMPLDGRREPEPERHWFRMAPKPSEDRFVAGVVLGALIGIIVTFGIMV